MAFAKGGNNTASDNDAFWKGVQAFMALLPDIVDQGGHASFSLRSSGFCILPVTPPGADAAVVRAVMAPYAAALL